MQTNAICCSSDQKETNVNMSERQKQPGTFLDYRHEDEKISSESS